MEKLISVIVPIYNTEQYLEKSLKSIQEQSYRNIEVILVDDGSKDRSGSICDRYTQEDERFHVIHQSNSGVSSARNAALSKAQGKYILFADSDDWLDHLMLEKMAEKADGTGTDLIICDAYNVYGETENDREIRYHWGTTKHEKNIYYTLLYKSGVLWNKLIGIHCIRGVRFNTELRYGEDQFFLYSILDNISRFFIVNEPLYYYRKIRNGNVVSAPLNERYFDLLKVKKMTVSILLREQLFYWAVLSANDTVYKVNCAAVFVPIREALKYRAPCKELLKMCAGEAKRLLYESDSRKQGLKLYLSYKLREFSFVGTVLIYKLIVSKTDRHKIDSSCV